MLTPIMYYQWTTFRELEKMGVKFDVRKVPSDAPGNMDAILNKAQHLLDEQKK